VPKPRHPIFRGFWWSCNLLLAIALFALAYSGVREFSVRRDLDGYSDAIVPNFLPSQQKVQAILDWMRAEPSRGTAKDPAKLEGRDPQDTLNYAQLLKVCGTATNAFLNLARASDLQVRRLLLLSADGTTKHVVAEVSINQRWVVVDPTYRVIMNDAPGHLLTRKELPDSSIFEQAASFVPSYPREYSYDHIAHVRTGRLPIGGRLLRKVFDFIYPGWEESVDGSRLLERPSFFYLVVAAVATLFFLLFRQILGGYADSMLRIPRFHFREHVVRAGAAFFSTPEIKE
jgi:Transglutaminase-like superfamily